MKLPHSKGPWELVGDGRLLGGGRLLTIRSACHEGLMTYRHINDYNHTRILADFVLAKFAPELLSKLEDIVSAQERGDSGAFLFAEIKDAGELLSKIKDMYSSMRKRLPKERSIQKVRNTKYE